MAEATKRCAVVTGGNKGIGFSICKQLASNGVTVVLTARDEKRGLEAVEKLKQLGLSGDVVFHQLDVTDPASIASLVEFVRTQICKVDILVNNAGIPGANVNADALATSSIGENYMQIDWSKIVTETYQMAKEGLETNYYGAKRMAEALIPFLHLSNSPRIVNVSSSIGKLENIPSEWAKGVLNDVDSLTEDIVDNVVREFLIDFKEGSLKPKGWPTFMSAYVVSKVALNAYTRILAKKYLSFCINCVCPGYVKTDITHNTGHLSADEGAESVVKLALLPHGSPSGCFFYRSELQPF